MKIAILCATYNGGRHLNAQIKSILAQTISNFTLYIRDDGSEDDTLNIINDFQKRDGRVVLISDGFKGTGTPAGNFFRILQFVNLDEYSYVAFSDQDDVWDDRKLEASLKFLEKGYEGYSSALLAYDSDRNKAWYINKSNRETKYDYLFQTASAGCTYVISKKAALIVQMKINKADFQRLKSLSHDWYIYAVCRAENFTWYFDAKSYIFYRQHSSNAYGDAGFIAGFRKKIKLLLDGWYKRQILNILSHLEDNEKNLEISSILKGGSILNKLKIIKYFDQLRRKRWESYILTLFIVLFF